MRLFTGVFPPAAVQTDVRAVIERAPGVRVRWTAASNLHLTMVFLGEVSRERLDELKAAVDATARGATPFAVALTGLGGFPSLRRPRVLYLGCRDGSEPLRQLHRALVHALPRDLRPDDARALHPHVTLARVKHPLAAPAIEALAAAMAAHSWRFSADRLDLVATQLRADGAVYERVHHCRLGA